MVSVAVAVDIGEALLRTIFTAKRICDQRRENNDVALELTLFVKNLQQNIRVLNEKQLAHTNTATWAIEALQQDLEAADVDAKKILNRGFITKLWHSNRIQQELRLLRERVMTSFQINLLFTALNVTIANKKNQQEFQESIKRLQRDLSQAHSDTSSQNLKEIKNEIRKQYQEMWKHVQSEMRAHGQSIEDAINVLKRSEFQAQTDDSEKFFADVLHSLEQASQEERNSASSSRKPRAAPRAGGGTKWYHDPITWDIMCDPVKASDRRTYDRWTLIKNSSSMNRSPFDRDKHPLKIEFDDIDVRGRLFQKFPEQEEKYKRCRREYRQEALEKAKQEMYGDALLMLNHVLLWAPDDSQCKAKRDEMQRRVLMNDNDGSSPWSPPSDIDSADGAAGMVQWMKELQLRVGSAAGSDESSEESDSRSTQAPKRQASSRSNSSKAPAVMLSEESSGESSEDGPDSDDDETPTRLNTCRFSDPERVSISRDRLSVKYLKKSWRADDAVCFQSDYPCTPCFPSYYFEMKVKDRGAKGGIAIGYSTAEGFRETKIPGMYEESWAYHGDGDIVTCGEIVGHRGKKFDSGDTVGAGYFHTSRQIFFTHNGHLQGFVKVDGASDSVELFPTVGLQSERAEVTLNFGQRDFMPQPLPAKLELHESSCTDCSSSLVSISDDGLEACYVGKSRRNQAPKPEALQADHPAACSELLWYYFELTVKDAGEKGCIAIGFTDGLNFQSDMQPGWYPNSVGYHGDDGNLFVGHGSDAVYRGFGPTFTTGDVIGAGVYYGTDELFFVKNGKTVGCASASTFIEGCLLYPTVGLHSRGETVLLNFKEELFVKEVVPTCLHYPSYRLRQGRMLAVLADHCAPVRADFYFELTVSSRGLTIGFASLGEFIDSKQPGLYAQSCGYDGDEGACYAMSHTKFETRSVPEFGPGDTVGAGLDRYLNIIFFTHNGKAMQSVLPYSHVFETCLVYPTIAMARGVQSLNVNFGDRPFVWEG